jgi:hypothetical protein
MFGQVAIKGFGEWFALLFINVWIIKIQYKPADFKWFCPEAIIM